MSEHTSLRPRTLSRRQFIKITAATVGLLAGCRPVQQPSPAPTAIPTSLPGHTLAPPDTPVPTPTSAPTATPLPTSSVRRPEVIKMYPNGPSKVVHTHHAGVWNGENLVPEAIRQMLDASIAALTGLSDATAAWAALFAPHERVAIKVNTYGGSFGGSRVFTHVPLVMAVVQSLQEAGVPAEQVFVYDYVTSDLEGAGYSISREGPGVRCYGTAADWEEEGDYAAGWTLSGKDIGLSRILLDCDALINIPVLKTHGRSGFTFALKNHYGTFDRPEDFHGELILADIAELNALPPIKDRTRLIIGDALEAACLRGAQGWPDWSLAVNGDSVFMSFDPVALDTIGLEHACELAAQNGQKTTVERIMASATLKRGAELGVGAYSLDDIELIEATL
ncbi:MAG TPA: DUF362 domain-containing protein [Anaerolineae bacterium]|nr:DUF362 domain-containing protein [Anaerolineae bacterium]